jgi:hypothetical protein
MPGTTDNEDQTDMTVTPSSGCVFTDLGLPKPTDDFVLIKRMRDYVEVCKLTGNANTMAAQMLAEAANRIETFQFVEKSVERNMYRKLAAVLLAVGKEVKVTPMHRDQSDRAEVYHTLGVNYDTFFAKMPTKE